MFKHVYRLSYDNLLLKSLKKYGFHIVNVQPENDEMEWSYTVGLNKTLNHPEIAIFGMVPEYANIILQNLFQDISTKNVIINREEKYYGIFSEEIPLIFKEIEPSFYNNLFGIGLPYFEKKPLKFLQCVWPDLQNYFPSEKNCVKKVRDKQDYKRINFNNYV